MRVHFDPNAERAFVFDDQKTREFYIQNGKIKFRSSTIREDFLYRHCTSVETVELASKAQIQNTLNMYGASNIAQLVRNALFLYKFDSNGADEMLKLLEPKLLNYDNALHHLYVHILRNSELLSIFQGDDWALQGSSAWNSYRSSLTEHYSIKNMHKVCKSWQAINNHVDVSEEELFTRGRQKGFFRTLYEATQNDVDLDSAYLDYCELVGNVPRKKGSLESQFFSVFGGLSRSISTKKRIYHQSIAPPNPLAKPSSEHFIRFLEQTNEIRENLEKSLSSLASKIHDQSVKRITGNNHDEKQKEKLETIFSEWNNVFHITCLNTSKALVEYFQPRHSSKPRITIKAINLENDSLILHTIYRDHDAKYVQTSNLEDNTGFQFALRTGRPFLSNNVHASYKVGIYKNPRLAALTSSNKASISNKIRTTKGWVSLWKGDTDAHQTGSYRSTMIVPIDISRLTGQNSKKGQMSHDVVTAFLCIDHISANYFDPKADLNVMQTGANLFRSYFTTRHTVLVATDVILSIVDKLKNKFATLRIESNFESHELNMKMLKSSIVQADSRSTISVVDYSLRYLTSNSEDVSDE